PPHLPLRFRRAAIPSLRLLDAPGGVRKTTAGRLRLLCPLDVAPGSTDGLRGAIRCRLDAQRRKSRLGNVLQGWAVFPPVAVGRLRQPGYAPSANPLLRSPHVRFLGWSRCPLLRA